VVLDILGQMTRFSG
jgi:hypothetical protein